MTRLQLADVLPAPVYAMRRVELRARALAHKRVRTVLIGPYVSWSFDDAVTVLYQVQEQLRAEALTEPALMQLTLDSYNQLVPDGHNWKASCAIDYPDPVRRGAELQRLHGLEHHCWVQVGTAPRITATVERRALSESEPRDPPLWSMRFDLDAQLIAALKAGAPVSMGVDHPAYQFVVERISDATRAALVADLR